MATCAQVDLPSILCHSLEDSDEFESLRVEAEKRRDYREIVSRCSLSERYLKSDLSIVLELAVQGHHLPVGIGPGQADGKLGNCSVFVLQFHAIDSSDCEHWDQEAVFVVNVESMERTNIAVPSLVRFHAIDHEIEEGRGVAYSSSLSEIGYKLMPRIWDGKLRVTGVSRRTKLSHDATPCDIESAMEIVNCIANDQCNIGKQGLVHHSVVNELLPRLEIAVQAGAVCVGRGVESLVDIRDVLFGPFDL